MIAIDIDYFDGYEWWFDWDSRSRLEEEYVRKQEDAEFAFEASDSPTGGITSGARDGTGDRNDRENGNRKTINARTNEVSDADSLFAAKEEFYNALRPPVAIPVAVRVQITFLAGDEKGAYEEKKGVSNPNLEEYTFSSVVQILAGMKVPLLSEEEFLGDGELDEDFLEDGEAGGGTGARTGSQGGTGSRSGTSGAAPRGR
jgi:hypothetical protein